MPNFGLSQDLIEELLANLPVRSLLRFRCVCKSWRSIISSSQFSNLLLDSGPDRLYVHLDGLGNLVSHALDYEILVKDNKASYCDAAMILQDIPWGINFGLSVYGSCNGLIFFCSRLRFLCIWNPSTRECNILPRPAFFDDYADEYFGGFAYDKSIDDYKVVVIGQQQFRGTDGRMIKKIRVEVLALKTNTWRRIQDVDYSFQEFVDQTGVLVNGTLNWLAATSSYAVHETGNSDLVLGFDLASEKFQEVTQLKSSFPQLNSDTYIGMTLCVLEGCLCVSYKCVEGIDIWIMKEYGLNQSWIKLITLPFPYTAMEKYETLRYYRPLCFSRDGAEIIGIVNAGLMVKCNLNNRTFQRLVTYRPLDFLLELKRLIPLTAHQFNLLTRHCTFQSDGPFPCQCWAKLVLYKESLVSPHGG